MPVFAAGWAWHGRFTDACVLTLGYAFGGYMFNGDLDLVSRPWRRWGPLRHLWKPYQRAFRHRSGWTHGVLVGPLVRVLYVGLVVGCALAIARVASELLWPQQAHAWWHQAVEVTVRWLARQDLAGVGLAVVGVYLGSALHTACDHAGSLWKSWRRAAVRSR